MSEFCLFCNRRPRAPNPDPKKAGTIPLCLVCAATPLVPQRVAIRSTGRQEVRRLDRPTTHLPGTEGKIAVLERRFEKGFHLWHPNDWLTARDAPAVAPLVPAGPPDNTTPPADNETPAGDSGNA